MDVLDVYLLPRDAAVPWSIARVGLNVNGRPLTDVVAEARGAYGLLRSWTAYHVGTARERLAGVPDDSLNGESDVLILLDCECPGEWGCWYVSVEVSRSAEEVEWRNARSWAGDEPHVLVDHPFPLHLVFARDQYDEAVNDAVAALAMLSAQQQLDDAYSRWPGLLPRRVRDRAEDQSTASWTTVRRLRGADDPAAVVAEAMRRAGRLYRAGSGFATGVLRMGLARHVPVVLQVDTLEAEANQALLRLTGIARRSRGSGADVAQAAVERMIGALTEAAIRAGGRLTE